MPPIVSLLPALWVAPRCPPIRPARRRALVWGWHLRHCVVYAPGSADEGWPQRVPSPTQASPHVHRSRSDRCGWLLVYADLAGGKPIPLCPPLRRRAVLIPLCFLPDPPLTLSG